MLQRLQKKLSANAHAVSVRIGVVHGFLAYIAVVVDSNYDFHTVLVDAGNGKVLTSAQMSTEAMMMCNGIMMGPGTGMMFGHPTMSVIKGPEMMFGHPLKHNESTFFESVRELDFAAIYVRCINYETGAYIYQFLLMA
ncbi:MAG: hypothetical protein WAM14_13095 [Candidatus Nitrosopolaris sp.]